MKLRAIAAQIATLRYDSGIARRF